MGTGSRLLTNSGQCCCLGKVNRRWYVVESVSSMASCGILKSGGRRSRFVVEDGSAWVAREVGRLSIQTPVCSELKGVGKNVTRWTRREGCRSQRAS